MRPRNAVYIFALLKYAMKTSKHIKFKAKKLSKDIKSICCFFVSSVLLCICFFFWDMLFFKGFFMFFFKCFFICCFSWVLQMFRFRMLFLFSKLFFQMCFCFKSCFLFKCCFPLFVLHMCFSHIFLAHVFHMVCSCVFFHDFHSFFPTSFSHVFFILCLSFVLFPMCCFHRSVTFSPALSQHLQWQMLCPSGLVAWAMVIFEKTQMTPKVLPLFTVSSGFAFLSICLLHLFFSILICTCFSYVFPPCCCHTCFTMFLYVFHNFQRVFMCFFYMFSHFLFHIFLPCFTCFFIC